MTILSRFATTHNRLYNAIKKYNVILRQYDNLEQNIEKMVEEQQVFLEEVFFRLLNESEKTTIQQNEKRLEAYYVELNKIAKNVLRLEKVLVPKQKYINFIFKVGKVVKNIFNI